ncbi:Uncharacterised protein [Serratia marcescens]|nr:Uncharacterised protein [Serratia marcescens]
MLLSYIQFAVKLSIKNRLNKKITYGMVERSN